MSNVGTASTMKPASFRTRATLGIGLLMAAMTTALSFILGAIAAENELSNQVDVLRGLARNIATSFADGLLERMREVETLAAAPYRDVHGNLDLASWGKALARTQTSRPQFSWIGVADANGHVLVDTGGFLVGRSVVERPWFQAALKGSYTGDVHAAKLLGKVLPPSLTGDPQRFIDFAAPIRDGGNTVQGVLGVHGSWDWAHQVIASMRSARERDRGIRVFVLNREGEVLHRPLDVKTGAPPVRRLREGGAVELVWDDGRRYLTAAARLPARDRTTDLGWTIVTCQPIEMALAPARTARFVAFGVGLIATLAAMPLVWWLAGRFGRPLADITQAARRVQAGDLEAAIPVVHTNRELEQLSTALAGMQHSLRERADVLERRVAERTAELEQLNGELAGLARRDALTGLFNRRAADERLQEELARHRRTGGTLALALADIDRFKSINDTHGHQKGDEVIKEVSRRLAAHCRSTDFVARYGGEEFLVLMPETSSNGSRVLAEKLRAAVEQELVDGLSVTLSIGVANSSDLYSEPGKLIHAADECLYAAKTAGRNRVVLLNEQQASSTSPA